MAFFSEFPVDPNVPISWAADFRLSKDGVLVSFTTDSIEATQICTHENGSKMICPVLQ